MTISITGVGESELCDLADHSATQAIRHFAVYADNARLRASETTLLVRSATPFAGAFHNAAFRTDPTAAPGAVLAEMREFEIEHRRDLTLWVSSHRDQDLAKAAATAGLRLRSTVVGMAITSAPDGPAELPGVSLRQVDDSRDVAHFAAVHEQVFHEAGQPADAVAHFASCGALLDVHTNAFVAYIGHRPVSCAMTIRTGRVAGIYWVATTPDSRKRGLGGLVTRAATQAAFDGGAQLVVLQATPAGLPLYRELGFVAFTGYHRYAVPLPDAG